MSLITFSYQANPPSLPNLKKVENWLLAVAKKHQKTIQDLSYIFCTDDYLLQLNKQYLHHDTLTDIITFDLAEDTQTNTLTGEIYISVERVAENAHIFQVSFQHELLRVIVHGLLHLLGYPDATPEEKEKMRQLENHWLTYFTASCDS